MPPTPWTPCARPATALAPSTDNDISGTRDQLFERADFLIASWEDLDPDIFLAKAGA